MIDLNKLREIAQAATPGHKSRDYFLTILKGSSDHEQRCKDAAHIAAFNPQTALELLDYVAKLEADRAVAVKVCREISHYCNSRKGWMTDAELLATLTAKLADDALKQMGEL